MNNYIRNGETKEEYLKRIGAHRKRSKFEEELLEFELWK